MFLNWNRKFTFVSLRKNKTARERHVTQTFTFFLFIHQDEQDKGHNTRGKNETAYYNIPKDSTSRQKHERRTSEVNWSFNKENVLVSFDSDCWSIDRPLFLPHLLRIYARSTIKSTQFKELQLTTLRRSLWRDAQWLEIYQHTFFCRWRLIVKKLILM